MGSQPFIVTAELPVDIFSWANGLRSAHFPPERNHLAAHVTLFHAFAPSLREELRGVLARLAGEFAAPQARIDGLMDLGGGTALRVHCPGLLTLRAAIAEHFHGALTAQDQHQPRLHITIQNKVPRDVACALQASLGTQLRPVDFAFTGLGLHLYLNPKWAVQGVWRFRGRVHG
jgi:hypothetical protein